MMYCSPGESPFRTVTKQYGTSYMPPNICAESKQAETIIVAVEIRPLGLVQWNLSGIAAVGL
jgi:ABC-type multidrug transport system permease subunit